MAADNQGSKNQPLFIGGGAPDDANDLSTVSNYAALVGNRKVGTYSQRNGLSGPDLWEGLEFYETDTGRTFRYQGATWKVVNSGWLDFTPTYSGFSGGSVGLSKYRITDKKCEALFVWTAGSGVAVGNIQLTPPIPPASFLPDLFPIGVVEFYDVSQAGLGRAPGMALLQSGAARGYFFNGQPVILNATTSTSPFTWATGDQIICKLDYPID